MKDAVIVSGARTAVGRAPSGSLRGSRPDDMAAAAIREAIRRVDGLDNAEVEDVIIGCAVPEGTQGFNVARLSSHLAGLPDSVPGQTVNRFCASGLQTIAIAAERVMVGSHNWSNEGVKTNRDASLIFDDPEIAAYLAGVYDYDWNTLATAHPTKARPRVAKPGEEAPKGSKRVPFSAQVVRMYSISAKVFLKMRSREPSRYGSSHACFSLPLKRASIG